jgi:prephenate dehydratase
MEALAHQSTISHTALAPRIGIAAEIGSFSDEAALSAFGDSCSRVAFRDARQTLRALVAGEIERAVLPIENSLAGSVMTTYDAILAEPETRAVGQIVLPIHHCVLALPDATLDDIHTIQSHPVALAQCRSFFERHPNIRQIASYDTARSAMEVAAAGDTGLAAVASERAAARYGLAVIVRDVEDRADNSTRFLVMSSPRSAPPVKGRARTMLLYATMNEPGALLRTLEPLAARGMNLSKLESRPAGTLGAYRFVAEFEHDGSAEEAIGEIAPYTLELRHIGTWSSVAPVVLRERSDPAPVVILRERSER